MLSKRIKLFLPALVLSIGILTLFAQSKAFAGTVTSTFPRNNNWVLLSKYLCSGHCLDTPRAGFRVFYDTQSSAYLNNNTFSVDVKVICRGGSNIPGGGMKLGSNSRKAWHSCGGKLSTSPDYVISQSVNKGELISQPSVYTSRYKYVDLDTRVGTDPNDIIAIIVDANNEGKVTFQETASSQNGISYGNSNNYTGHGSGSQKGPYLALSEGGTAFAMFQNTGGSYTRSYSLRFKTSCDVSDGPTYLRWYDADQGTSTNPANLNFSLYDETTGSYVTAADGTKLQSYNDNLGGNDSYREKRFNIRAGDVYTWTWDNVQNINGVQLWLPYSEFSADIDCGNPAKGQITKAVCSTVVANSIKGENASGSITGNLPVKLRFHNGGPASPANTTYSGNSSGGKYSHPTPPYVQNRDTNIDVTVDLLVKDYSQPGDPYVQVDSATINEPCDGGGGATCPSIPSDPTDINLTGDNSKVPGPYNSDMGTYPLKPKDTVVWANNRNTANFEYVIQKITDQYGQDISVPSPHWSPQTKSDNPFHINWTPFINQYKYDDHYLIVTYTTYYLSYKYKATQKVLNPDGTTKGWKMVYTGDTSWNHTSPNDQESHPGNGNWAKAECYDRGFQVHDIDGSASINGDNESPDGATFTFSIPVNFFLPQGDTALRHPNKVCGINYNADYYIKRADGSYGGAMPGHPSDSGPIDPSNCMGGNWADDVSSNFTKSYSTTLVPPMSAGDRVCMRFSVGAAAGYMDENGSITSVTQPNITSDEFCSQPVVDKPYLRVYGSDVIAGYACPNPGDSRIMAYRSTDPAKSGSGTQFAAMAFNQISGFGSASLRNSSPQWPYGLTISNSAGIGGGASTQPNDGGFYSGQNTCPTDFYSTITSNAITTTDNNIPDINTYGQIQDKKQTVFNLGGSDLTVNSSNAYFNKQSTIFVDGNVIIKNNLKFQPGSYLAIIAKGNIYVDSSVTRLDGLYVAQPRDASTGLIYTCAHGTNDVDPDSWYNDCHSQLVVNGAFVADKIRFHRSLNSIRDSSAKEAPSNFSDGTGTKAAEVFNFSPEIYLYTPIFIQVTTGQPYQYITSLPPVL